jgi:uncharacterized paraquat-inducible protein A
MKIKYDATNKSGGIVEPAHEIVVVCGACGFDLDEYEIEADTCVDCGVTLSLKRSVSIQVTTLPSIGGVIG